MVLRKLYAIKGYSSAIKARKSFYLKLLKKLFLYIYCLTKLIMVIYETYLNYGEIL